MKTPMAKKSAMSKGYRKTTKKKPFLTKKELIALIAIVAAIIVGVILFNLFYDDGYLDADEVQQGDIVAFASSDLRDRYMKLGEIGQLEGFTLEERDDSSTPIELYSFTPDAENDNVVSVSVSGSFVNAASLASSTLSYMSSVLENIPEIQETTLQDHTAYVFAYDYSEYDEDYGVTEVETETEIEVEPEEAEVVETETEAEAETETEAEAEEPAHNKFSQNVTAYVAVDDTYTVCMHIYRVGADENFYLPEDQIVDFVQQYASAFTLDAEATA